MLGFVLYVLNDVDLSRKRWKFEETLKKAIELDKLKNEDLYLLAVRWTVKKEKISETLNFILSDYLNDKESCDEKLNCIRDLITWHQENDPFSDLPDGIKLQLQQIQEMSGNYQPEIIRLSKSLSEIYLSNQRQVKRERLISRLSLLIGIVGLLYGFFK